MTTSERTILHTVEGPKGSADVIEVTEPSSAVQSVEYEVEFQGKHERVKALGHAYILAQEFAGLNPV